MSDEAVPLPKARTELTHTDNFGIAYVVGTRGTADSAVMRAEL
jgi:hypothetical protein